MNVLVVGCGSIGKRHLTVLTWRGDVELAATDLDPQMADAVAAIDPRIRFFRDYGEALEWQPELVIVASPNHVHKPVTLAALAAGAHVLCEKPIADTVANGEEMVAAARAADRLLGVGYTERFRPAWQVLEGMAARGEFGTLVGGRAMVGTYNTIICSAAAANNPMFGSIIVDYTHELDMLQAIFGEVRDLTCRSHNLGDREGLNCQPHLTAALLEYANGAIVSLHLDYLQHPQRRLLEIYGDRRTAAYDLQTNTIRIFETEQAGCREIHLPFARNEAFQAEHDDMIRAIREGGQPLISGQAALEVLRVAERAIEQIRP